MALYQNNFNFLRLMGAALVIFSHSYYVTGHDIQEPVNQLTHGTVEASGIGLCIFFFISGYFVTKSAFHSETILIFLRKRALRIYPALIILVLSSVFILGPIFSEFSIGKYFTHPDTWKYLYTATGIKIRMNLPGVFENSRFFEHSVNSSLWTIGLELQLYLSLAFFYIVRLMKNKKLFTFLALAIVLFCLFITACKPAMDFFYLRLFSLVGTFYFGSFIYSISLDQKRLLAMLFALILLSILLLLIPGIGRAPYFLIFCSIGLLTYFTGNAKKINLRLGNDISYGLYIFAFPIQQILFNLTNYDRSVHLQLGLTFLVTIPIAFASWFLIERPCLALKEKLRTKKESI